jgi:hypothetical protein
MQLVPLQLGKPLSSAVESADVAAALYKLEKAN